MHRQHNGTFMVNCYCITTSLCCSWPGVDFTKSGGMSLALGLW